MPPSHPPLPCGQRGAVFNVAIVACKRSLCRPGCRVSVAVLQPSLKLPHASFYSCGSGHRQTCEVLHAAETLLGVESYPCPRGFVVTIPAFVSPRFRNTDLLS